MTSKPDGRACPDLGTLAAYIDRRLEPNQRSSVLRHLSNCDACLALVGETLSASSEVEGAERRTGLTPDASSWAGADGTLEPARTIVWSRREGFVGATIVASLLVALLAPRIVTGVPESGYGLADLAQATGRVRPVAGRLTGGFQHFPLDGPSVGGRGGALADSGAIRLVAGKIREDLDARATPERWHAFGVSQLLLGRWDDAELALAAAAREQSHNARYQSDLAAFYLERARTGERASDLPRALSAAEKARLADASLIEAWFNRALALQSLSLGDQARAAWAAYLDRDPTSAWAAEAREHLARLEVRTPAARWPEIEARLRQGVTPALATDAIRAQMTEARLYLETELWPAWTAAVEQGAADASRERESLRAMAEAFATVAGDSLYRDAVAAIDRAEAQGPEAVARLAVAHRTYAEAARVLADDRFTEADPGLVHARGLLAASRSTFVSRVDIDLAAVQYYGGRSSDATATLDALLERSRQASHLFLQGRSSWLKGLLSFGQGRYGEARAFWEDTRATFAQMGDVEQQAAAHGLLANLHYYLGDGPQAWYHRREALSALAASGTERIRHGLLSSAAGQVLKEGDPAAALVLQDAVLASAFDSDRAAAIAEALAQRASILAALGQTGAARTDLAAAHLHLARVPDQALRARLETMLLAAEVDVLRPGDAARAAEAASRAIQRIGDRGESARLPALYLRLAQSLRASGRPTQAWDAARAGIAVFDRERAQRTGAAAVTSLADGWRLYEVALRLAMERGDVATAFRLGDIARSRALHRHARLDASLDHIQARLEPDEAILALNQLDDELVLWLVTRSHVRHAVRALSREDASRLVLRQRDEIRLNVASPAAAAALFSELVRPLAVHLGGVSRVAVAPDVPFFAASFAGLWDADRQRFWVEQTELTVTAAVAEDGAPTQGVGASALVDVASPATPGRVFAAWSEAPANAIVRVPALAAANAEAPGRSRLVFEDAPGSRYSGLLLAKDLTQRLPLVRAVLLPNVDPGADPVAGPGVYPVAKALLDAGAASVVSAIGSLDADPTFDGSLRRRLQSSDSVVSAVTSFQRDALGQTGRRLGAWSRVVVYGAGR